MQKKFFSKALVIQIGAFALIASCQKEDSILSSIDVQNVNSEAASSAFISENLEITTRTMGGLTTNQYAGSRTEADTLKLIYLKDDRLSCALVTINRTGTKEAPAGTITVDYGDGTKNGSTCTDSRGVQRKGKIIITYNGQRWSIGSTYAIQFVDYYRNGTHVEGAEYDTVKLSSDSLHLQFISDLRGGKITFMDGKSIEREQSFVRTWYRFVNPETGLLSPLKDEWHVTGSAGGTNKNGNIYTVDITDPLITKISCLANSIFIPVKGTKKITVDSKNYVLNYGDGTCDNLITVSFNGGEKTISVNSDGN